MYSIHMPEETASPFKGRPAQHTRDPRTGMYRIQVKLHSRGGAEGFIAHRAPGNQPAVGGREVELES